MFKLIPVRLSVKHSAIQNKNIALYIFVVVKSQES